MTENVIDKVVSWFSPSAGLRRTRARMAAEVLLSYDGVRSARRQGGWNTTGASGNSEVGPALAKLRANSRDLCRNNPFARRAKHVWGDKIVGTGIVAQTATGSDVLNAKADDLWETWCNECVSDRRLNFAAAQKLVARTCFEAGECIVRKWPRRPEDGLKVPFQIQILEPDYLDISKTEQTQTGYVIHGVQFDLVGRIVGYWLFGQHPGEVVNTGVRNGSALVSAFVPADSVLHIADWEAQRPGQVRGVTMLAAVIGTLRDLDEYADAEKVRKKAEACLVGVVSGPWAEGDSPVAPSVTDKDGNRIEKWQPGMVAYGSEGSTITFNQPGNGSGYGETMRQGLHEIASGIAGGMPYEILTGDLSQTNYSSYRGGLLSFKDSIESFQWNVMIPELCQPVREAWRVQATAAGLLPDGPLPTEWHPPAFNLLDREAEAKADQLELQLGTRTWPQAVGRQGYDPRKQIAEIATWKPQLDAAGVVFAKNPQPTQGEGNGNNQNGSTASAN